MTTSSMLGGAALGKMAAAIQKDDPDNGKEDQIENFLNCKDKEVRVKLRVQTEGPFYEIEVDVETEYVQKFVGKLLKERHEQQKKRAERGAASRNSPMKAPPVAAVKQAAPRSASPMSTPASSGRNLRGPIGFFSTPLPLIIEKQRDRYPELHIPRFIDQAIKYIIAKGLNSEGLFRLSGTNTVIQSIKEKLNASHPDYEIEKNEDVHNITGLLKSFLRELPEPLLPSEFYHELLSLTGQQFPVEVQLKLLGKIIGILPKPNQYLLSEICWLLGIVAQSSELNKMPRDNLGKVIGPNILWTKETNADLTKMQLESDKINLVASMLINHHEKIFKDLAPPSAWIENPAFQTKYTTGNKKSIQCFAQAGETVWTADSSGVIRVLDINANSCVKELQVGKGAIFTMLCINNKMWVASERALQVYDIETYSVLKEHPFASFHIVHNADGSSVFVAVWEGIRIFDEPTMEQVSSFNTSNDTKVLFLRGNRLWVGSPKSLSVYDSESQQLLKEHKIHQRMVSAIKDLGDGRLVTTSADMKIGLWDAETLEHIKLFDGHSAKIMSLCVLPGTPYFFTSAWDCSVRVWNVKTLECVRELKGQHSDCISHIDVVHRSNDNTYYIWTASWDKFVCIWKPKDQPVFSPPAPATATPGGPPQQPLVMRPASPAGEDGRARLLDSAETAPLHTAAVPAAVAAKRNALANLPPPPAPLVVNAGAQAQPAMASPSTSAARPPPFAKK